MRNFGNTFHGVSHGLTILIDCVLRQAERTKCDTCLARASRSPVTPPQKTGGRPEIGPLSRQPTPCSDDTLGFEETAHISSIPHFLTKVLTSRDSHWTAKVTPPLPSSTSSAKDGKEQDRAWSTRLNNFLTTCDSETTNYVLLVPSRSARSRRFEARRALVQRR